jgi:hypothetical protein
MEMDMSQATLSSETQALISYLDEQRNHAIEILEGVDDETLRRPILPSGWSCLAMLQHLALDIERFWFRAVIAGEQEVIDELDGMPSAWEVDANMSARAVVDLYRSEIERSNRIVATTSLDAPPSWWPADLFGDYRLDTVREVVLHVLTETATHAGHLDAVRELIDGRLWLVLTE